MTREDIHAKFREAKKLLASFRLNTSPVYLEFLRGKRHCAGRLGQSHPQPARLEGPLLPDHRHPPRHVQGPDRENRLGQIGPGNDPRCENCMVHCGFEPAAVLGVNRRLGDTLKMRSGS